MKGHLAVIETHPIQYHAPVYRALQQKFGVPVTAIYGSDFSVTGYRDPEFGVRVSWDSDLLSGYTARFLSRTAEGGAVSAGQVTARGLKAVFRENRPAAVLLPGYSPRFYQSVLLQSLRLGAPILFRGETTDHAERRGLSKQWVRDRLLRWFYERCARLLYVGVRSLEHFKRLRCPDEKMIFSPYGVDTAPFAVGEQARLTLRAQIRNQMGIQDSERLVLFSGKLISKKGPDLLVSAVKKLPEEVRGKITLLFVGEGALRDSMRRLAAAAPAVKVFFAGFQNQSQLSPYYHAADLLVLPSLHSETWGLVVNEALHHGLPVVVSEAVGCAPDLVKSGCTGEVFQTGSAGELAAAVQRGLMLAGKAEVRERCRDQVKGYSVEKAAEGIARAYREVVTGILTARTE